MNRFFSKILTNILTFVLCLTLAAIAGVTNDTIDKRLFPRASIQGATNMRLTDFDTAQLTHETPFILSLGSSTNYRGISPAKFSEQGLSLHHLSSPGQRIFHSQFLLNWAIGQQKIPSHILLDVYPALWESTNLTGPTLDHIINNNHLLDRAFVEMTLLTGDPYSLYLLPFFGLRRHFSPIPTLPPPAAYGIYNAGFVKVHITAEPYSEPCVAQKAKLSRRNANAMNQMKYTCQDKGIQLLLVNPPQLCEEVFEKPKVMEGLPWIEGNDWPLAKVDSLYYDDHHLRGVGAELYSEWLAGQVLALMD